MTFVCSDLYLCAVILGLIHDGLWDVYNNQHMGVCGESCATNFGFSRKDQDDYAIRSYARAAEAWSTGKFKDEVAPISVKKKGQTQVVSQDEEYTNIQIDKIPQLKPAFKKDGTVTAANASTLV